MSDETVPFITPTPEVATPLTDKEQELEDMKKYALFYDEILMQGVYDLHYKVSDDNVRVRVCALVCARICASMHVCVRACVYACVSVYIQEREYTFLRMCANLYQV